jgi:hypothetical protein
MLSIQVPKSYTAPGFVTVNVRPGVTSEVEPQAVIPNGSIEGVLQQENGDPIEGAEVRAVSSIYLAKEWRVQAFGLAFSGKDGSYKLANVRPGSYRIEALYPDYRAGKEGQGFATTYYPGATSRSSGLPVEVFPARTTSRIDFRLLPAKTLHVRGRVTGATGQGQARIFVRPCEPGPASSNVGARADVQPDGSFDVPGLLPGVHCVAAQEMGTSQTHFYATQTVTLIDRDVDTVQLTATPPLEVSGRVELEEGAKLTMPSTLYLFAVGGAVVYPIRAEIDPKTGAFVLSGMLTEQYRLELNIGRGTYIQSIRYGPHDLTNTAISTGGETHSLTIRLAAPRARLEGRILDPPSPVASITVVAAPDDERKSRADLIQTTRSTNDTFRFSALPPGRYRAYAFLTSDADLAQSPGFLALIPASSVTVTDGVEKTFDVRMVNARDLAIARALF